MALDDSNLPVDPWARFQNQTVSAARAPQAGTGPTDGTTAIPTVSTSEGTDGDGNPITIYPAMTEVDYTESESAYTS